MGGERDTGGKKQKDKVKGAERDIGKSRRTERGRAAGEGRRRKGAVQLFAPLPMTRLEETIWCNYLPMTRLPPSEGHM